MEIGWGIFIDLVMKRWSAHLMTSVSLQCEARLWAETQEGGAWWDASPGEEHDKDII